MVQATNFLLRWLFLNNLIRDRAELQSLPYIRPNWQQQEQYSYSHDPYQSKYQSASVPQQYHEPHLQGSTTQEPRRDMPQDQVQEHGHGYDAAPPTQLQQQYQHHTSHGASPARHHHHYAHNDHPETMQQGIQNNYADPNFDTEIEWKQKTLHSIQLYPPGALRLLALDSLRLKIVHEFARELHQSDKIVQEHSASCRSRKHHHCIVDDEEIADIMKEEEDSEDHDPSISKDVKILDDFEKETSIDLKNVFGMTGSRNGENGDGNDNIDGEGNALNREDQPKYREVGKKVPNPAELLSNAANLEPRLKEALALQRETREYLPQLVSAILHSPQPLTQRTQFSPHLNPLATLRRLLITRCVRDPNLGIELCWLLEAEVGRTWKKLFEHRQQTGRRLIILLPADKAVVIQKIGSEKRNAFDLLQDVECATAYGVYGDEDYDSQTGRNIGDDTQGHGSDEWMEPNNELNQDDKQKADTMGLYSTPRLPASLSMKRCDHFGDTMHFIDQLTQISLDLVMVPNLQRKPYMENRLEELNRRLRRRMVSKGNVSLDVEDNRGPQDWPTLSDVAPDSLKYSIHFPLEPTATVWPGKNGSDISCEQNSHSPLLELKTEHGMMRVLNIVSNKCRVLASRERCPYLVHCEVVETGLGGRDARLYSTNSEETGATLQEVMGVAAARRHKSSNQRGRAGFSPFLVPSELSPTDDNHDRDFYSTEKTKKMTNLLPRGGNQRDGGASAGGGGYNEGYFHSTMDESGYFPSAYDLVRDEQLQQVHEHLQNHQTHPHYGPPQPTHRVPLEPQANAPMLTTYSNLLDRVFGLPWAVTCENIRRTSPYGNAKGWRLASFIMKAGEDIRREALVMQVISKMKSWFDSEIPMENRPFLKPYTIMCVGGDAGLLECLRDAKSVDEVKKSTDGFTTLREYFLRAYGPPGQEHPQSHHHQRVGELSFEKAQDNFLRSLVGYSLVCYILQIKDRHNANILIDREGHIMHIDFGFVLGDTPKMCKIPVFNEGAPFKLTSEFWEVIGGWNSNQGLGVRFCKMFEEAFACASAHCDELVTLIESAILNLTQNAEDSRELALGIRERLRMRGRSNSPQQQMFIINLVNTALTSWGTSTYDWLQKSMNGYI